jgi:mono/diheme cytochrome c family protein
MCSTMLAHPTLKTILLTMAVLVLLGLAAGWAVVRFGLYNVSATATHTRPVYGLLEHSMRRSVQQRAAGIAVPAGLDAPDQRALGAACFRALCVDCHGAPGVAPQPFAQGLQPVPGSLIGAAREWQPRELYWLTRYGIKMSGMPAWQFRLSEEELWAVVAFLGQLPALSTPQYRQIAQDSQTQSCPAGDARPLGNGSPRQEALLTLRQHACTACHSIPGVTGPDIQVGPPLAGFGRRSLIAGRLPNTPDNLVRWIRAPQSIDPHSAMPDLGVSEAQARLMADYLMRLH